MRPINADELEKTLGDWIRDHWTDAFTGDDAGSEFADMIDHAKTIELSPIVHARWIKYKKKHPENEQLVLGVEKTGYITRYEYIASEPPCFLDDHEEFIPEEEIVAWMPLPEYEEDDDEFIRKEDFV